MSFDETTAFIELDVVIGTDQSSLIAPHCLGNVSQSVDYFDAEFLSLLRFRNRNILNVSCYTARVDATVSYLLEAQIQFGFDEKRAYSDDFIGIIFDDNRIIRVIASLEPSEAFYVNTG